MIQRDNEDNLSLNDRTSLSDQISGGYSEEYKTSNNDPNSVSPQLIRPKINVNPCNYVLATPEKTAFYKDYENDELVVRGPEFSQDLSFWIVHGCTELMDLEKGIPLSELSNFLEVYYDRPGIEFNLLQRFT